MHLSTIQRQETTTRILHDPELINRGATVTETGRLALADSQLEYLILVNTTGMDATTVDRSAPPSRAMDAWLDIPLGTAWEQTTGGGTIYNVLEMPLDERPALFYVRTRHGYVDPLHFAETSNVPEVFAVRFELARQELEYRQS